MCETADSTAVCTRICLSSVRTIAITSSVCIGVDSEAEVVSLTSDDGDNELLLLLLLIITRVKVEAETEVDEKITLVMMVRAMTLCLRVQGRGLRIVHGSRKIVREAEIM